ncbi:hypothetical protein KPL47_10555 [Clostridium estertheticum]|uniref:hypothetical protein n=1 Tax=Clostridium estertheticum TaxID=238834 RepID=UPI001C0D9F57|nr:hypothetical protein [Clostridium estertheticum]MBU3176813.1 hypothetical protein [Clostridium estertheticum]
MKIETNSSTRIYKDKLSFENLSNLSNILYVGNEAKIKAYSILVYNHEKGLSKSIHLTIKNMFNLNTYYTNYATCEAKLHKSSNVELNKMYIDDLKQNINHREKSVKDLINKIKFWSKIHAHIIDISKAIKNSKSLPKFKYYRPYYFYMWDDKIFVEANYKNKTIIYNMYDFEHALVVKKISRLTNKLNMIKRGISYQKQKLARLNTSAVKSCFGTKKLFKSQHTLYNEHFEWKEDFYKARHKTIELQGLNTVTQGNACVKYNYKTNLLKIQLPYENKIGAYHSSQWFEVENVDFPYHKDSLIEALNTKNSPVSLRIEDKGDYFLFKPSYKLFKDENQINYSKANGIVGYDINYDHIAWSETDCIGNLLDFGTIHFNITNKTSGQISKILEKSALGLVQIARYKNKPLAGEDIKNISKSKLPYGNTKRNMKISMFAHKKIIEAISSRAFKENLAVFYVNPAYTSQMGKIKYMKAKGISIHVSAAFCIARRALGYKEKIPLIYRTFTNNWRVLSKELKTLKILYFYKISSTFGYSNLKAFVKDTIVSNYAVFKEKPIIKFSFN